MQKRHTKQEVDEKIAVICDDLAAGSSVVDACAKSGIDKATLYRWLAKHKEAKALYDTAQVDKLYTKLHECVDLCDSVLDAGKDDNNKVQAVKLKVNTIQWFASHMFAKQFGNKTIHSNDPENPVSFNVFAGSDPYKKEE